MSFNSIKEQYLFCFHCFTATSLAVLAQVGAVVVFLGLSCAGYAQSIPDAGAIQRAVETTKEEKEFPPDAETEAPSKPQDTSGPKVDITTFTFIGNKLFSDSELQPVVEPWQKKPLSIAELKYIAALVSEFYRQSGYLARVYFPEQDINDGRVIVAIVESQFGKVDIEDQRKIDEKVISTPFVSALMSAGMKRGEPLKLQRLERNNLILNDLAGVTGKTLLTAGAQEGETDLNLKLSDTQRYSGSVDIDNYGVRSTGEARVKPYLLIANPLHRGDSISLLGLFSEGNQYARAGYEIPVSHNGLKASVSASYLTYELGAEFADLEAEGDASSFGAGLAYPLIRQLAKTLFITASLEHRSYSNSQLGESISDKVIQTFNLGTNGYLVDDLGRGGVNYFGMNLVAGDLDLSGNEVNQAQDAAGPQLEGSYALLSWNYGRLQRFTASTTFWASIVGQFSDKKLDSSETMSLGGPSGVRAYPVLEASGDAGAVMTFEVRHKIDSDITVTGFFDYGFVDQKSTPVQESDSHSLKGLGVSLTWTHPTLFSASFDIARRIGSNPLEDPETGNDSNGTKTLWPVWMRVTKRF